jgi:hypothetical protein
MEAAMSHATIYFLTTANAFEQAESKVMAYLEGETFFDYSEAIPDLSGPLKTRRKNLDAVLNGWNWRKAADALMQEAENYKAQDDLMMFGHCHIRAGALYAQTLNIDTYVFNIDTGDYCIPEESGGWWVIAVDFHH